MRNRNQTRWICVVLALGCLAAFSPLFRAAFINYDDPDYVTHNSYVKRGLTLGGAAWAFTTAHAGNWHPLTWLSHMLDCQLYGLTPAGHHLTNMLLHAVNALLLFALLNRLTGALWRSAVVAALFAWHPLHVESVAWVSERKDLLCALFWLLAVGSYANYAKKFKTSDIDVTGAKSNIKRRKFLLLSLLFFALGLMSKPMVVTLPFVLLLLDYWPLERAKPLASADAAIPWSRLVFEKASFFALSAASSVITFAAQQSAGAVSSLRQVTFAQRLANAPVACARYLRKTVWPDDLAVIYPLRDSWSAGSIAAAVLLLAAITLAAIVARRSRPYLLVGWLWFLGMLVPVIGLVQVGSQSMADRYTYLPLVGVFVMLVWGAADAVKMIARPAWQSVLAGIASCAVLSGCLAATWRQARVWENSITLFAHALAVNEGGTIARADLGEALASAGKLDEARVQYEAALQLMPDNPVALFGLGLICVRENGTDEAIHFIQAALRVRPSYAEARYHLGLLRAAQGRAAEAIAEFNECLRLRPDVPEVHYSLGNALMAQGDLKDAAEHYQTSLRLDPKAADVRNNLGAALLRMGQPAEAVEQFKAALELRPEFPEAEDQLGGALQKLGRLDEAREHFERAVQLDPGLVHARLKLGMLSAQQGRFDESLTELKRVTALEPTNDVAWFNLAGVFAARGRWLEAADGFRKVIELKPTDAEAHARRATALEQAGRQAEAIDEFERAASLTNRREPQILAALDQAYAAAGRYEDAMATAQQARAAASALNQSALAEDAARRLERYRAASVQR